MNNSSSKRSRAVFQLDAASALTLNTITLMTFMAASSAPTPLYRLYQQLWQFSPVTLTLIFATYAFTLLGSLLIIGSLSDYIGRRPVIIAAISLQIISMSFFLFASDVSMLFIARGLQGIATGLAVSAIGAAILDFSKLHGSLINSIAPMIGMAVGIFLTCSILQFSAHPLQLVFEFLCFLLICELILSFLTPETAQRRSGALASLKPNMAIPSQTKSALLSISPINIALWMVSGFFLSLMPSLLAKIFQTSSAWLNGIMFMALALSGAVGILTLRKSTNFRILLTGTLSIAIGAIVLFIAINLTNAVVLFLGSIITGVGFGTAFMGAIRSVMPLALPEERAGLMAAFFVESYLAFSIPAILAGYFVGKIGLMSTANSYISFIILLSLVALLMIIKNFKNK
ncbi:TPA: MFS transporter [Acinetobacter baumannii]|uniref:MFS transporter n=1 Tax=Acinetobacter baumannii TaxID=470 RepID=UPI0003D270C6|nr:MFS transporter [Acinetobacter baumannii]AHB90920.1 putative mutlidrug resistance protein [Acinetobacter baumannii ZW85-1]MDC4335865.1 MFS transporter [Acinetobacter baumannii]MDC4485881.1 MFS transporter [Acinetobacter baumannii]MDC4707811.1 MFS transporter [Acinetobacter baumannii]MDC5102644.1 MFS transporter [Acinetobacter baumannii]